MQTTFAALALVAALLGLGYSNVTTLVTAPRERTDKRLWETPRSLFVWVGALVLAGFLATLSTRPPFAPGLSLGWGFLIAGALALYAALDSERPFGNAHWLARGVGLLAAAVFGVSLILLVFRGYPNKALMGYSLGAILAAAVWRSCLSPQRVREAGDDTEAASDLGVELFALAAVALAVGARLGIEHFPRATTTGISGGYWSLPALITGVAALAAIIPARMASQTRAHSARWRPLILALIATGIAMIIVFLLAEKLLGAWHTGLTALVGAAGFGLAAWLACETEGTEKDENYRPVSEAFGMGLLSLAIVAVAFKMLHGYGEGLALSGGLALVVLVSISRARSPHSLAGPLLRGGFVVVLLLTLYRLFLERIGAAHPFDFQQHYNYFGLAIGALIGFGLLGYGQRAWQIAGAATDRTAALRSLMAQAPLLGIAVVLAPLALLVVWGLGALSGFLIGLVVAELCWMLLIAWATRRDRAIALAGAPHVYLVAMSLVAIQFSPALLALIDVSRSWKALIVVVFVAVAMLWVIVKPVIAQKGWAEGGGGYD